MQYPLGKQLLAILKRSSLRRQIILALMLLSSACILLMSIFYTNQLYRQLENNFQLKIDRIIEHIIPELEYPLLTANNEIFVRVSNDFFRDSMLKGILVSNKGGEILFRRGILNTSKDTQLQKQRREILQRGIYIDDIENITSRASTKPSSLGWLEIIYSTASLSSDKNSALLRVTLFSLLALILSYIASMFISRWLTEAHRKLKNKMDCIASSQKFTEIEGTYPDELEQLKSGVNQIISTMHYMYSDVDQKLSNATKELTDALEKMKAKNLELDHANRNSLEAVRIKSEFMSNMSHELRTPMNGIIGFTDLLLKSNLTDEQLEYTQTVRTSASNLLSIINDILDFTKLESGELHIEKYDFNLRDVIEDVITYLAPSIYDKNLEIVNIYYGDTPEYINSDPVRIRQVITNLVANAIKFTKNGHIVIRTMLEESDTDELELRISVEDTGIGLSIKDQEKLFTAFTQADTTTTRKFGGIGVGLVICREIADRLGGAIGIDSTLAVGSTFWFSFRCTAATDLISRNVFKYNIKPGFRTLLYDSKDLARNSIAHLVKSLNINFEETKDPFNVTQMANDARDRGEPFHTIILGLNNQELLNNKLTEIIENIKDEHHYTFLVLINSTNKEILDECYRLGADICLPKSAKRNEILNAITQTVPPHLNRTDSFKLDNREQGDKTLDLTSVRILVVDDNEINRKLVVSILQQFNTEIVEACSGQEAIRAASAHFFDLIFMDIHMPEMNGIEATEAIRRIEPSGRRTPVIALTANAVRGEKERLIRSGLDGCIIKPIKSNELSDILHKWIDETKIKYRKYRAPAPNHPARIIGNTYTRNILGQEQELNKSTEFAKENPQLVNDLKKMFIDEVPKMKEAIRAAYQSGKLDRIVDEAHKIHGAASCCAILGIKTAAHNLENIAAREKHDQIDMAFSRLIQELDNLRETIKY